MDLQIGILCIFIAVISSVIIYLISVSSVRENSFEEAKAKRNKILKQHFEETRQHGKIRDKKTKKYKKAKETHLIEANTNSSSTEIGHQKEDEKENSENSQRNSESSKENQIPEDDLIKNNSNLQKKESKKIKPEIHTDMDILKKQKKSSKDQGRCVDTPNPNVPSDKSLEEYPGKMNSCSIADNSLFHRTDLNKQNTLFDQLLVDNKGKGHAEKIVNQVTLQSELKTQKSGKKRSDVTTSIQQLKNEGSAVNINLLMTFIQKAELSHSEIQLVIDALLNMKQQGGAEWLKGRQDPIVKLKKQLAEKEQALVNEQEATLGLRSKLEELRAELNIEKVALRHFEDTLSIKDNECRTLAHKLQLVTEESQNLILKAQQLQRELLEERSSLSQMKEKQVVNEAQEHEIHTLKAHINQITGQLQEQKNLNSKFASENLALQEGMRRNEDFAGEMKLRLSNSILDNSSLQSQVMEYKNEIDELKKIILNLQTENKVLVDESQLLSNQIKVVCQERSCSIEASEVIPPKDFEKNGDLPYSDLQPNRDFDSMLKEKECSLFQLHSELEEKIKENEKLKSDIIAYRNEANNKQSILENFATDLSNSKSQLTELADQLSEKDNTILQLSTELSDGNREILALKKEIGVYKERNNELRNKNWKVIEALSKAEQAIQKPSGHGEDVPVLEKLAEFKKRVSDLFKRLFPEKNFSQHLDNSIWLKELESSAFEAKLNMLSSANNSNELELQNRHLRTVISHYKTIIVDTEGMLNSLQNHIEVEETKWSEKIQSLQSELDGLRYLKQIKEIQ